MEQKINIHKAGQFNNIKLADIDVDNHIVVEKVFAEGYKNEKNPEKVFYGCKVKYQGVDCSFLLDEKKHEMFKAAGGIGDKVKISKTERTVVNSKTKIKMIIPVYNFEKVE